MTTAQILFGLGIGALTGILAALCGVGGGLIMVPAFVFLMALDQKSAVATSLAVIISVSLVATYKYQSASLIKWQIVWPVMLGAVVTTLVFGLANDVYFQVGLLTTIGLSAKNAILIVEFAKELREQGQGRVEAALPVVT
jgi:multidrug efflux pump subunit AcrB